MSYPLSALRVWVNPESSLLMPQVVTELWSIPFQLPVIGFGMEMWSKPKQWASVWEWLGSGPFLIHSQLQAIVAISRKNLPKRKSRHQRVQTALFWHLDPATTPTSFSILPLRVTRHLVCWFETDWVRFPSIVNYHCTFLTLESEPGSLHMKSYFILWDRH